MDKVIHYEDRKSKCCNKIEFIVLNLFPVNVANQMTYMIDSGLLFLKVSIPAGKLLGQAQNWKV